MDSDDDEPVINHYVWMSKIYRQKSEDQKRIAAGLPALHPIHDPSYEFDRNSTRTNSINSGSHVSGFSGVSSASQTQIKANFLAVVAKAVGALLFVGVGIGALIYSVYKSPTDSQLQHTSRKTTVPTTTAPKINSPFQNLICSTDGLYTFSTKIKNGPMQVFAVRATWRQNDDMQFAEMTLNTTNSSFQFHHRIAFSNATYTIKDYGGEEGVKCTCELDMRYSDYIKSFGDPAKMSYERTVTFYDHRDRNLWEFWETLQSEARFRYADPMTQLPIAWSLYPYDAEEVHDRHEFWFGDMKPWINATQVELPSICYDSCQIHPH